MFLFLIWAYSGLKYVIIFQARIGPNLIETVTGLSVRTNFSNPAQVYPIQFF